MLTVQKNTQGLYGNTSPISNLHDHLQRLHPKAYVEKCTQNKWLNMIKSLCPTVMIQTSIEQFAQVGVKPHPTFSTSSFRSALAKWIVADNSIATTTTISQTLS